MKKTKIGFQKKLMFKKMTQIYDSLNLIYHEYVILAKSRLSRRIFIFSSHNEIECKY